MGLSIFLPTEGSRSGLEWPAVEGDSPVYVTSGGGAEPRVPRPGLVVGSWEAPTPKAK
jgi:hypothetical protein